MEKRLANFENYDLFYYQLKDKYLEINFEIIKKKKIIFNNFLLSQIKINLRRYLIYLILYLFIYIYYLLILVI